MGTCACCVPRVACPCGSLNPHRCAQCGMQRYCNNMCNMTIDGALLSVSSGTLEGSLVPPAEFDLPIYCWYSLRAPPGHRIEIQLHRLVHVGTSLNDTSCRGGYVEIADGDHLDRVRDMKKSVLHEWHRRQGHTVIKLCGEDQRLHPPAVIYSDTGRASIIYKVIDWAGSPRFMVYYNFPPITHAITGDKQWGGTRVDYTECDWLYQDIHCSRRNVCYLTSPGHPGIYPLDSRCKYFFTMTSASIVGVLEFVTMDLPPERCTADYLALYTGTSTTSSLISTLCGQMKQKVTFSGPSALMEFSTGDFFSTHKFSGFYATLYFTDGEPPPTDSPRPPPQSHKDVLRDPSGVLVGDPKNCLRVIWSNSSRGGSFDTSTHPYSSPAEDLRSWKEKPVHQRHCRLRFVGDGDDVVQVSFFKYTLRGQNCSSKVSVYDGVAHAGSDNLLRQICGPVTREPKDRSGNRFLLPEFSTSSSNVLEIHLELAEGSDPERQFLTGAFQFFNTHMEGTRRPNSVCDVMFYGASSRPSGFVTEPTSPLLWNVEGHLACNYLFVPAHHQSVRLSIKLLSRMQPTLAGNSCRTVCSVAGCHCVVPPNAAIENFNRLVLIETRRDSVISCICSTSEVSLPMKFQSSTAVEVNYFVANYAWLTNSFNFSLFYEFLPPFNCGPGYHNKPAGLLVTPPDSAASLGSFLFVSCTWIVEIKDASLLDFTVQPPVEGKYQPSLVEQ